jgi:hypothetical protein
MEFGIFDHVDASGVPLQQFYDERLKVVEAYDRAGFYCYHVAEHHATPLGLAASPAVYLAGVAQRTKQLRFGPLVYTLPLYHPLRITEEICMLDQMSSGRMQVGIGRGISPLETKGFGIEPAERVARYEDTRQVMMQGLTQKTVNFQGKFFSFDNVPMELEPFQKPHPPIWIGAAPPKARPAPRATATISFRSRPARRRVSSPTATAPPGKKRTATSLWQSSDSDASSLSPTLTRRHAHSLDAPIKNGTTASIISGASTGPCRRRASGRASSTRSWTAGAASPARRRPASRCWARNSPNPAPTTRSGSSCSAT